MKLLFVSLGCDKNLVDSEMMIGMLHQDGFEITNDESEADIIVINTCCFIHDAKEESIETIIEMGEWKEKGRCKALIVAGCLAQRYREEIKRELPEVDAIIGTTGFDDIIQVVKEVIGGKMSESYKDINYLPSGNLERINTTGGYYSYLKIAEGCDKHCTYCIIPSIRGNYRSIPIEDLLEQAVRLAEMGTKELILVAQETTLYGMDLYGKKSLPELLRRLSEIEGIEWVRLLYCYPEEITDELIQVMKENNKICHYIDMPVQHASDTILKRMGRRTDQNELREIIKKLRNEIPDIAIRTTLITGFPGETENDHKILCDFIKEMRFERLGVFTYSPEEDTPAAVMENQIEEELKEKRKNELMEIQQEIAFKISENQIGHPLKVLIEGKIADDDVFVGRSYMDSPNVDGCVFVPASYEILSGEFVDVVITDSSKYDLIGDIDNNY